VAPAFLDLAEPKLAKMESWMDPEDRLSLCLENEEDDKKQVAPNPKLRGGSACPSDEGSVINDEVMENDGQESKIQYAGEFGSRRGAFTPSIVRVENTSYRSKDRPHPLDPLPTKITNEPKKEEDEEDDDDDSDSEGGNTKNQAPGQRSVLTASAFEKLLKQPFQTLQEQAKEYPGDHFFLLMKILIMVFEGKDIPAEGLSYLSNSEMTILLALFSKKCKVVVSSKESKEKIAERLNSHKASYKHKRNEENYKLVFKKAVKHLAKKMKQEHPRLAKDKTLLVKEFYFKYFREDFHRVGLDVQLGLDYPREDDDVICEKFGSTIFNPKTVNPKYISTVANSSSFIEDVITYLNNHFFREYSKNRYAKVERILQRCHETILFNPENMDKVRMNIEKNPRFKLPWYDDELYKAMKGVRTYLETKCNVPSSKFTFFLPKLD